MADAEYGADCIGAEETGSWDGGANRHDHRIPELEMQIGVAQIGPERPQAGGGDDLPEPEILHFAPSELLPPLGSIALHASH